MLFDSGTALHSILLKPVLLTNFKFFTLLMILTKCKEIRNIDLFTESGLRFQSYSENVSVKCSLICTRYISYYVLK